MNRTAHILAALLAAGLLSGCNKQSVQSVFDRQEAL